MPTNGDAAGDRYVHFDAAYVLGTLSGADRRDYERHLATCRRCRDAVRELAGLPGLLAKTPLEGVPPNAPHPPEPLLPRLLDRVNLDRRRRRRVTAAAWVTAAVAACLAVVMAVTMRPDTSRPAAAPTVTMSASRGAPIEGTVRLENVPWGTRITVWCSYAAGPDSISYAIVAVDRDGKASQVGTWRARPGRTYEIVGATALERSEVAAVEVRTSNGVTVLTWTR